MPLVSVIMPSYNHEKFIVEAIESVLNQTIKDFELIVIDDYSHDNSHLIIEEFEKKDERIKKIFHQKNLGIAKTLNEGIKNSNGKYIALIASDDSWMREKLEKQLEILKEDEDLIVWCNSAIIDHDSKFTGEKSSEKYDNATSQGHVFDEIMNSWISGSGIIMKKENLKKIQFNESLKYLNDTLFYLDLAYRYKFHYMEETLSKYRLHGENASYGKIEDIEGWYNDSFLLCNYVFDNYGDSLSYRALKNIFYKTCVIPTIIGTQNDLLNKFNLIYPVILFLNFTLLTIKSIPTMSKT